MSLTELARAACAALILLAACGRVGFDPETDGPADDTEEGRCETPPLTEPALSMSTGGTTELDSLACVDDYYAFELTSDVDTIATISVFANGFTPRIRIDNDGDCLETTTPFAVSIELPMAAGAAVVPVITGADGSCGTFGLVVDSAL